MGIARTSLLRGLAAFVILCMTGPMVSAQEDTPPVQTNSALDFSGFEPLQVVIRPRERVSESGIYRDAVVESIHGKFYRFSGLYIDDLLMRRSNILKHEPAWPGAGRPLSRYGVAASGQRTPEDRMTERFVLGNNIGMVMGAEYTHMDFLEIAAMFNVDPTPEPIGMPTVKGIYAESAGLNQLYDQGNHQLGVISFAAARPVRLPD